MIKALNYPTQHGKSQAERLALKNKKLLEIEAEEARLQAKEAEAGNSIVMNNEPDEDEENTKKKDDGKLDMLNLYVRELREPRHQPVPEERKS